MYANRRAPSAEGAKATNEKAVAPQSSGTGANGMLRFYTEDSPGLIMYVSGCCFLRCDCGKDRAGVGSCMVCASYAIANLEALYSNTMIWHRV